MLRKIRDDKVKLGIIGLGYIGLPLAAKFARRYDTVGFDVKPERLEALRGGCDTRNFIGGLESRDPPEILRRPGRSERPGHFYRDRADAGESVQPSGFDAVASGERNCGQRDEAGGDRPL